MKISILLITYNHEKYIQKAIESILIQKDCPGFEIIVSDDHSDDNTLLIVSDLIGRLPNVQIFSNPRNLGITRNYQRSFALCKGEYIFVLEGDDYWIDPLKLKKQVEFLDQHPFCVMCGHPYILQKEDMSVFTAPAINTHEGYNLFDCKDVILDASLVSNFSTCCFRRSILEKISSETYSVTSYDWMINISVAQYGFVGRINSPMSVYRVCSSGAWSKISEVEQLNGIIKIIDDYNRILNNKYAEYFETKKQALSARLNLLAQASASSISLKQYFPPVLTALGKLLIPPVFLRDGGKDRLISKSQQK